MKVYRQANGIKITKEYFSKTLEQDFEDGKFNINAPTGMHCVPHTSFSKDKNRKIVSLRMDWGFMMKGYIEFFMDDCFYVDYSDFKNEQSEIDVLIFNSKGQFKNQFKIKSPKKINIDFKDFHGQAKDILLRDQILAQIHSRDSIS